MYGTGSPSNLPRWPTCHDLSPTRLDEILMGDSPSPSRTGYTGWCSSGAGCGSPPRTLGRTESPYTPPRVPLTVPASPRTSVKWSAVGSAVQLSPKGRSSGCLQYGEVGTIIRDDGPRHVAPYQVRSPRGDVSWYAATDLQITELAQSGSPRQFQSHSTSPRPHPFAAGGAMPLPTIRYNLVVPRGQPVGLTAKNLNGKIVVTSVTPGGPAHTAGVTPGSVLARVHHLPIASVSDVLRAVDMFKASPTPELVVEVSTSVNVDRETPVSLQAALAAEREAVLRALRAHERDSGDRKAAASPRRIVPSTGHRVVPGDESPFHKDPSPLAGQTPHSTSLPRPVSTSTPPKPATPPSGVGFPSPKSATGSAPPSRLATPRSADLPPTTPPTKPSSHPSEESKKPSLPPSKASSSVPPSPSPSNPNSRGSNVAGSRAPSNPTSRVSSASTASPSPPPAPSVDALQEANVRAHNTLREKHSAPPVSFDQSLANNAQKQADACASKGQLFHGNCDNEGQNCFRMDFSGTGPPPEELVRKAAESWYDEIKDFKAVGGGVQGLGPAGHFTQLVWKESTKVGLGYATKQVNGMTAVFIAVNYSPPGNMATEDAVKQNVSL